MEIQIYMIIFIGGFVMNFKFFFVIIIYLWNIQKSQVFLVSSS